MEFGTHTFYILVAYTVSIVVIAGLIGWRIIALRKAIAADPKGSKAAKETR